MRNIKLMADGIRKVLFVLFFLWTIIPLGLTGCATSNSNSKSNYYDSLNLPRIHTIGSTAILNFEKGQDINIPIEGQNLQDLGSEITASAEAPIPLVAGTDYYLNRTNAGTSASLIFLKINKSATTNLNSKDHLLVNVSISERHPPDAGASAAYELNSLPGDMAPTFAKNELDALKQGEATTNIARQLGVKVALGGFDDNYKTNLANWLDHRDTNRPSFTTAFYEGYQEGKALAVNATNVVKHSVADRRLSSDSRTFILFTPEDYRSQVLANQIEIQNITAFPLPDSEARKLFGDLVAQKFYAVRLTLLNPTKEDQIVSLGLIKAYGRALVEPAPASRLTRFTRPIEVAPQSQQQVYTMVQSPKGKIFNEDPGDNKPDWAATRDWFFGTLEFAGAMATAYGTGFGASQDYVKAVALATGAGIPGLGKLFDDKRPFYLLNIVNFAMPDLVKIPRGGSLDGKYLFFSKGQLQAVLQDPQLKLVDNPLDQNPFEYAKFFARVIYLEFDTLQIPFENTTAAAGTTNLATEVETLRSSANTTIAEYKAVQAGWTESGDMAIGNYMVNGTFTPLGGVDFTTLKTNLPTAIAYATKITSAQYAGIATVTNLLKILQTNVDLIRPSSLSSNLFNSHDFGYVKLDDCLEQLKTVDSGLLQGQPDSLFQNTVDSVSKTVISARDWLDYYKGIGNDIQQHSPWKNVADVITVTIPPTTPADTDKLSAATNNLNTIIGNLPPNPKK